MPPRLPYPLILPFALASLLAACALPPSPEAERAHPPGSPAAQRARLVQALQQARDPALLRPPAPGSAQATPPGTAQPGTAQQPSLATQASSLAAMQASRQAASAAAAAALPPALAAAYQKPVALELREATLRQVFEVLARNTGVNFVFDKDVRGDAKVTVFLRQVSLDEAMRVVLATQQLDRKLLNDNTVLIYPNTAAKQREHQELITRSLYLGNADARQAMALVRTMTKTRDLHADERLNVLVVRDTPEVVRQIEQLIATLDLPEPEVMLAVEVMELASNRLDELGLGWPGSVQYGVPGLSGAITLNNASGFRASVANPALAAALRGDAGTTQLLANPTIRARNHEKAKVQIGDKLPVFTTTSAVNVGVSTSVSYLDVGLKLDIEPAVQLDGDVTIKLALEVSNLLREVSGPGGSLAYQVGTRLTTTSLRLKDGETQVLAGLISDEDRQRAVGLPGLSTLPTVGRLFGVHSDTRNKTEIVMLITPHIVRRLQPPPLDQATLASGTDSQPGALPLRLRPAARIGLAATAGSTRAAAALPDAAAAMAPAAADMAPAAAADGAAADAAAGAPARATEALPPASVLLSSSDQAVVGGTLSVTLANRSALAVAGELVFDALMLAPTGAGGSAGRAPFQLAPQAGAVLVLRVLPAAAGQTLSVQVQGLAGTDARGQGAELRLDGEAQVRVAADPAAPAGSAPGTPVQAPPNASGTRP